MKDKKKITQRQDFSKAFYARLYVVLLAATVLLALYNGFQVSLISGAYDGIVENAKEASRPADIGIVAVTTAGCPECYDISPLVSLVESSGANVQRKEVFDVSSAEGRSIIARYGIEKAPALVLTGELEKAGPLMSKLRGSGEEREDAYVFTKVEPPYVETGSGKVRGVVSLKHLVYGGCDSCVDLAPIIAELSDAGVEIGGVEVVDIESDEGMKLVEKHGIERVPAIVMDQEVDVYANIKNAWDEIGTVDDGYYVMREIPPPYYSVEDERVKGIVSMTVLGDDSCSECYNASEFHKPILDQMGVFIKEEKNVDALSAAGKLLIDKYNIKKLPTIILEGDMDVYTVLASAWKGVGTVEQDGAYVFRSVELGAGPYMDLETREVVRPSDTEGN